jgi:hypothetical protein
VHVAASTYNERRALQLQASVISLTTPRAPAQRLPVMHQNAPSSSQPVPTWSLRLNVCHHLHSLHQLRFQQCDHHRPSIATIQPRSLRRVDTQKNYRYIDFHSSHIKAKHCSKFRKITSRICASIRTWRINSPVLLLSCACITLISHQLHLYHHCRVNQCPGMCHHLLRLSQDLLLNPHNSQRSRLARRSKPICSTWVPMLERRWLRGRQTI